MKAIKILQDQHRDVEALFKAFEKEEDVRKKMTIFMEIADALAAHATIEEKVFYPGVKMEDTEEMLREAVEEHLSVKRIIADLLEMDASDEQFEAKVTALQEQVEHHVKEEENDLFVQVRKELEDEELEEMGLQMENLMAELMAEGEPSKNVPMETGEAAPV